MQFSFCSLSGNDAHILWNVNAYHEGVKLCPDGGEIKGLDSYERKVFALGYRFYIAKTWLRALPVLRPLREGECVCLDQCEYGKPSLQCRLAPDPNAALSLCRTPVEFSRGIGLGVVAVETIPQLRCEQGKVQVVSCDDQ